MSRGSAAERRSRLTRELTDLSSYAVKRELNFEMCLVNTYKMTILIIEFFIHYIYIICQEAAQQNEQAD